MEKRTMSMELLKREKEYREKQENPNKGNTAMAKIYRPLPLVPKEEKPNRIFVPLMRPSDWKMFTSRGYSLRKPDGSPFDAFYLTLPLHRINNYSDGGKARFSYILCNRKFNKFLVDVLDNESLFEDDRCAFCEAEQQRWAEYNQLWETIGIDRKDLSKDGFQTALSTYPVLKSAYAQAKKLQPIDKNIINVFDLDKFTGMRPLDEGQQSVEYQYWATPKSIFDVLFEEASDGEDFYNTDPTTGLRVVRVKRDNSDCNGNDMSRTKYTAKVLKENVPASAEWLSYLDDTRNMVDASDYIPVLKYEEAVYYVNSGDNKTTTTPVAQPAAQGYPASNPVAPQAATMPAHNPVTVPQPPVAQTPSTEVGAPPPPPTQVVPTSTPQPTPPLPATDAGTGGPPPPPVGMLNNMMNNPVPRSTDQPIPNPTPQIPGTEQQPSHPLGAPDRTPPDTSESGRKVW